MFGRTYASGFEADLEDWLLRRPRRTALNPAWPWGIWYPLRRTGAFARLTPQEQGGDHPRAQRARPRLRRGRPRPRRAPGLPRPRRPRQRLRHRPRAAASCTRCRTWSRPCARPPRPRSISRRWGRSSSATRSGRARCASTPPMAQSAVDAPARLTKKLAAFVELRACGPRGHRRPFRHAARGTGVPRARRRASSTSARATMGGR